MTLKVSLPPDLERRLREWVDAGRFASTSDVICEALRLFEACQTEPGVKRALLHHDISLGLADQAAGRIEALDIDPIQAEVRRIRGANARD